MNAKKILYLLTFIFLSCVPKSEVIKEDDLAFIILEHANISDADVIKWHVGPLKRETVSKGIRLILEMPQLEESDLKFFGKSGSDSWLLVLRRKNIASVTTVGRVYISFYEWKKKLGRSIIKQKKNVILLAYYNAASTTRLEGYSCPLFKHNKLIGSVELQKNIYRKKPIKFKKSTNFVLLNPPNKMDYSAPVLKGGKDLMGDYYIDIALFNSTSMQRTSTYSRFPSGVKVSDEVSTHLKGCEGFDPRKEDLEETKVEQFRFGR